MLNTYNMAKNSLFMEKIACIGILLSFALILSACATMQGQSNANAAKAEKINVISTFYPLHDITKKIGGDKIEAGVIVPAGVEPHDYEPSPGDILKLSKAGAFVTMGLEFSGIEDKLTGINEMIFIIDSKKGIMLLDAEPQDIEDAQKNLNYGKDPHIWLSPNNMIAMSINIRNGLKSIDPKNANVYEHNAQKLIDELKKLDSDYKKELSSCKKNAVITSHRSFAYLGRDYGFRQIGIFGLAPQIEPTPKQIISIKNEAKKNNVTYIFSEELLDPRISETMAKEIGAKILVLDPVEGVKNPSDDYFSLMRKNLANLRLALGCS
mgnify:CR=1 FL=1